MAAQQMQVHMHHHLVGVRPAIHDQAITASGNALFFGQLGYRGEHTSGHGRLVCGQVVRIGEMLVWNDQDVDRRQRMDIAKSGDPLVLIDLISRYLPGNDLAKDTVFFDHKCLA